MGVVAECTHLALNERVALKMLRQDVLLDADAVERFMREAQAAVKLRSEYVARVSDVGTLENGTPYMVMEYLDGMDLGQMIAERGHLPATWAATMMLQTAEALAEAHSIGIVHRDVKPTNLFVTWRPDGSALIKVLDFGISKMISTTDMHLTQTQSLLGTPAYMSPEQMRSARLVDARTDIWSLGSVMYELLEGRRPFEAESFSEMCVKVAVDPPAPMTNAPPELAAVVLRCLAKSPEQRYPSMADLGRDLIPFAQDSHQAAMLVERMQRMLRRSGVDFDNNPTTGVGGIPTPLPWHGGTDPSGRAVRPPSAGAVPSPTSHEPSVPARAHSEVFAPPKRRSRLGLALLGMVLLGGAAGIAVAVTSGHDPQPAATTSTTQVQPAPTPTPPTPTPTPPPTEAKVTQPPTSDVGTTAVEVTPPVIPDKPVVAKTTGTTTKIRKPPVTKIKPPVVKKEPKEIKESVPPKETRPEVSPPTPKCDAFDHPHGCPGAK